MKKISILMLLFSTQIYSQTLDDLGIGEYFSQEERERINYAYSEVLENIYCGREVYASDGFRSRSSLKEHFSKHRGKLGVGSEEEYLSLARAFSSSYVKTACFFVNYGEKTYFKFDIRTNEFLVVSKGYILTYFVVSKRKHKSPSNFEYFLNNYYR